MRRILHTVAFFVEFAIVFLFWYYLDFVRESLGRINGSLATNLVGQPGFTNPGATVLHPAVTVGLLFVEALIATLLLGWLVRLMFRNAGTVARKTAAGLWAHLLGIIVIVASPALALFEASIFWGDVTLWGYTIVQGWDPPVIKPWMTQVMGLAAGAYVILQFLPLALTPFIGFALAVTNIISSIPSATVWAAAFGNLMFGSKVYWTPFMTYGLESFSISFIADILVILIVLRMRARGYIATGSGADEAVAIHR